MNIDISTNKTATGDGLSEKLAAVLSLVEQHKGIEPVVVRPDTPNAFTDAIIVVGATSRRHARGIADAVNRLCHERNYEFFGMEGYDAADWILVDCNDFVVNIFQEDCRKLYRLEDLWEKHANTARKEILP